jgi:hypothetical protein
MPGERADVFRTGQDLPNQYPLWLSDKLRPAQTGLNLIKPDRVNEYRIQACCSMHQADLGPSSCTAHTRSRHNQPFQKGARF